MWHSGSWGDRSSSTAERFRTAQACPWYSWGSGSRGIRRHCAGRGASPTSAKRGPRGPLRPPLPSTLKAGASGQEPARKPSRADIRMEIHVEAARVAEQLGQRQLRGGEMRVGDKDALLLHVDVRVGE